MLQEEGASLSGFCVLCFLLFLAPAAWWEVQVCGHILWHPTPAACLSSLLVTLQPRPKPNEHLPHWAFLRQTPHALSLAPWLALTSLIPALRIIFCLPGNWNSYPPDKILCCPYELQSHLLQWGLNPSLYEGLPFQVSRFDALTIK